MKQKLLNQAKHEYSPRQRFLALLILAPIFLLILPLILIRLGLKMDASLGWVPILSEPINGILGWILMISGWGLAIWSIYSQFTVGRGTPVPIMATQKLIVQPPFTYCRNPMALGAISMYFGAALLFRSLGAVLLVLLGAVVLFTYIKLIEEKEMILRFGQEYLEYRQRTPFLIPRIPGRPGKKPEKPVE
jgi:protein-S-isoprenylcysteine O-methyltransferase Ste14